MSGSLLACCPVIVRRFQRLFYATIGLIASANDFTYSILAYVLGLNQTLNNFHGHV